MLLGNRISYRERFLDHPKGSLALSCPLASEDLNLNLIRPLRRFFLIEITISISRSCTLIDTNVIFLSCATEGSSDDFAVCAFF